MSDSSNYCSVLINEHLMIAAADGDPEAKAIVESWKPKFNIVTIAPDDPSLKAGWEIHFA